MSGLIVVHTSEVTPSGYGRGVSGDIFLNGSYVGQTPYLFTLIGIGEYLFESYDPVTGILLGSKHINVDPGMYNEIISSVPNLGKIYVIKIGIGEFYTGPPLRLPIVQMCTKERDYKCYATPKSGTMGANDFLFQCVGGMWKLVEHGAILKVARCDNNKVIGDTSLFPDVYELRSPPEQVVIEEVVEEVAEEVPAGITTEVPTQVIYETPDEPAPVVTGVENLETTPPQVLAGSESSASDTSILGIGTLALIVGGAILIAILKR